jgi:hypothetical protein
VLQFSLQTFDSPGVLSELGRVLVSQDEDLLREGARWLNERKDFSGIIYAHQLRIMTGQMVEDPDIRFFPTTRPLT